MCCCSCSGREVLDSTVTGKVCFGQVPVDPFSRWHPAVSVVFSSVFWVMNCTVVRSDLVWVLWRVRSEISLWHLFCHMSTSVYMESVPCPRHCVPQLLSFWKCPWAGVHAVDDVSAFRSCAFLRALTVCPSDWHSCLRSWMCWGAGVGSSPPNSLQGGTFIPEAGAKRTLRAVFPPGESRGEPLFGWKKPLQLGVWWQGEKCWRPVLRPVDI